MEDIQLQKASYASGQLKSPLIWGALLCGVTALFTPGARAQTASKPVFYYPSKHQKQILQPSQTWVGVQVAPGASLKSAAASVGGGETLTSTVALNKQSLVVFKAGTTNLAQTRANLRARALKSDDVLRTVRTFGDDASPIIETKEFMVRFTSGVTQAKAEAIVATVNAVLVRPLGPQSPNGYLVRLKDAAGTASIDAANTLNARDDVKFSIPNLVYPLRPRSVVGTSLSGKTVTGGSGGSGVGPRATTFNDPLFGQQWHLQNTGQNGGVVGADAKVADAWDVTTGSASITICINDDGVETSHPDLAAHIVQGRDELDQDNDPNPDNGSFHGTACAGVAAAIGNNGVGVSGASPNARIMPIRLLGNGETLAAEVDSFVYAADHGADIISNSFGPADGDPFTPHTAVNYPINDATADAITYATTNGRGGKGCVVLFAAGNGNESMDADGLASYPKVIAVGASNNLDKRSFYSDYGQNLDIVAPSGGFGQGYDGSTLNITTTDRVGAIGYGGISGFPDYTNDFNGTSSACPLAAGVAGLVLSVNPNLTYDQVRTILINSADKIDAANAQYDSGGHSIYYGYGRINALKALQLAAAVTVRGSVKTVDGTGVGGVTVAARTGSETGPIVTSAKTNSDGVYSLGVLKGTTYYITPVRGTAKIAFSPRVRVVAVTGNTTGVNFVVKNVPVVTLTAPLPNTSVTGTTTVTATTTNDEDVKDVTFFYHSKDLSLNGPARSIADDVGATAGITTSPVTVTSANATDVLGVVTPSFTIQHAERSDLIVTLIDPSGNRYLLYNRATVGSGTLQLSVPLALDGINVNGTWTLEIRDIAQTNTGTLNSWTLGVAPKRTTIGTDTTVENGVWSATWNTVGIEPGTYTVAATAEAYSVDSTDENDNIQVISSLKGASGTVTLNGNGLQGVTVTATLNGNTVKSTTTGANGTYAINNLAAGTYKFTPVKSGYSFNPASATVVISSSNMTGVNFTATTGAPTPTPSPDTTAPVVTVTSPSSNSISTNVTSIVGLASDVDTYVNRVRVSLGRVAKSGTITPVISDQSAALTAAAGGVQWTLSTGALAEGVYRVTATARDAAGNMGSAQSYFFVDRSAPTVTIGTPSAGSTQTGAFTATGTAADAGTYVRSVRIRLSLLNNGQPVLFYTGSSTLSQTYDPNKNPFGALTDEGEGVRWKLNIAKLPAGTYLMEATATDASARTATTTSQFTIK